MASHVPDDAARSLNGHHGEAVEHPDVDMTEGSPALNGVPHSEPQEESKALPRHSTRGTAPGPGGCWALNRAGAACGAPRRGDSDYCNAHSGYGVASDPASWSRIGHAAAAVNRRRRAELRLALGIGRSNTPRGVLRAAVFGAAEPLARRAVGAALDPRTDPERAARLSLDLIREADPPMQATLSTTLPADPEGVASLSLTQLLSIAEQHGIDPSPPALPEGAEGPQEQQ